jgi:hypothetical protein
LLLAELRKHEIPSDAMLNQTYETLDERIINTIRLRGSDHARFNARLYEFLVDMTYDGPGYTFIQKYKKTMDGRAAWFTLCAQGEGPAAITTRINGAHTMIDNAQYTGKGNYPFKSYVETHTRGHNILFGEGEPMAERLKVQKFMQGITDDRRSGRQEVSLGHLGR